MVNRINDRSSDLMFEVGHRAIAKSGEQASQGDETAADTLSKIDMQDPTHLTALAGKDIYDDSSDK